MKNLEIWTDGGKNKELASWAFCLYSPDMDKVIYQEYGHLEGTSQEGELSAGIKAMEFIKQRFTQKQLDSISLTLYTDSQYLQRGMTEWLWGWKHKGWKGSNNKIIKNITYWRTLDKLKAELPSIKFKWVKGHAGIELNEFVDGLCSQALKEARQLECINQQK